MGRRRTIELGRAMVVLEERPGYLFLVESGRLSARDVRRYQAEVDRALRQSGLRRMLVDARGEVGEGSAEVREAMWRWLLDPDRAFDCAAFVLAAGVAVARVNMTALSRGANLRAFETVSAAQRWLERGGRPTRATQRPAALGAGPPRASRRPPAPADAAADPIAGRPTVRDVPAQPLGARRRVSSTAATMRPGQLTATLFPEAPEDGGSQRSDAEQVGARRAGGGRASAERDPSSRSGPRARREDRFEAATGRRRIGGEDPGDGSSSVA